MTRSTEAAALARAAADPDVDWVVTLSARGAAPLACDRGVATASDQRLTVAFNGTLYNATELCAELGLAADAGAAEVVRAAWARWQHDALTRLKGLFLLAVHDAERRCSFVARDPLGVTPGFYAEAGELVHLSPSVATLTSRPDVGRRVNRIAIADHLCHRWPDPEETYFENIRRVPPGHYVRFDAAGRQPCRYWDPVPLSQPVRWASDDEIASFETVLDRAVSRAMSFGRTAIFLSGGFDSISVGAFATDIARRDGHADPIALSLGFPDPSCDEEIVQRGVARQLGIDQEFVPFMQALNGRGLIEAATGLIATWPVPMLNLWNPAYLTLAQRGRARGCKVVLTGNGGDEWLAVSPFLAADLIRSLDVPGFIRFAATLKRSYKASRLSLWRGAIWTFGLRPLLSAALGRVAPVWWRKNRAKRFIAGTPAWVAPDRALRAAMDERAPRNLDEPNPPRGFYLRDGLTAILHPLMAIELEENFEFGRRAGVRMLHPYWDADLVDLLMRIPPDRLNHGGRAKGMVRHMLARRFPGLGFERQKKVAATSFYHRILLEEGPRVWKALGGPRELSKLEIVDERMLESTVQTLFAGSQPQQLYRIWDVLGLESWLRAHIN
ncbi:MAG TPA: asparagine synthase-related protein [Vicinamibacterales bacterium]